VCEVLIRNYNLKVLAGENHPTQHKTKTIFGSISLMEHGLKEMGKNIFSLPTGYHHLVASCTGMYIVPCRGDIPEFACWCPRTTVSKLPAPVPELLVVHVLEGTLHLVLHQV
jgi:hypothetical protein